MNGVLIPSRLSGLSRAGAKPAADAMVFGSASDYRPDFNAPRGDSGWGASVYQVLDRRGQPAELMAVLVDAGHQPRSNAIVSLSQNPVLGLLNPIGAGNQNTTGQKQSYVICTAPPGPSLQAQLRQGDAKGKIAAGRMSDLEIIETVLRPVAHALDGLASRNLTHRAIRPDNIFSTGRDQPCVLGAAWAGPPGASQPKLYDPPYLAQCHAFGRGQGSMGDDIYALGVTMLVLAIGETQLLAIADDVMIRRKLHQGSFSALVEEAKLPPALSDLLRGMLAEDPEHRPPPLLLTDPSAARARRVAARPPRRGQRPIELGGQEVWNVRSLAHLMTSHPEAGINALKTGAIDRWLRRMLGDSALAQRLDQVTAARDYDGAEGPHADLINLARATAVLDPLAPFHWRGTCFWPDALGALIGNSIAKGERGAEIEELLGAEAITAWAAAKPETGDQHDLRTEARNIRVWLNSKGLGSGLIRVLYGLNPTLPCQSKLLGGAQPSRLSELLASLDAHAAGPENRAGTPADRHLISFIAARSEHRLDTELNGLATAATTELPMALLRLYASLHMISLAAPLPHLGAWMAGLCVDQINGWRGAAQRGLLASRMKQCAEEGSLRAMYDLLADRSGRAADRAGAERAWQELLVIDGQLGAIDAGGAVRATRARAVADDIIGAIGIVGFTASIIFLVLGL